MIPEDWEVDEIQYLADITTGAKNTQDREVDGAYPFFVRSQTVERINSYSYDGEAVLTAGDGVGTGKVFHYIKGKFDFHQRVYKISNFSDRLNGYYFYLYFSKNFYSRIMQMTAKSSVDSVRRGMIAKMSIPFPTKAEQEAIAAALSDADALISSLEKQIAKKRAIKQGAMQELLKPKEGWEVKSLKSLGVFRKGKSVPKSKLSTQGIPCILYGEIYTKYDFYATDLHSRISTDTSKNATEIKFGDILFAGSGETAEDIGKCFAYIGREKAFAGGDVIIFSPHNTDSLFLGFILNSDKVKKQKAFMGQGSSVFHIYPSSLEKIQIPLPPTKAEQTRIAHILSDMDAEIEALEKKLQKYKMIKQGMMQNLLTGRIRLVQTISQPKGKIISMRQPATKKQSWEFNEAVVISVLTKEFGSEQYPLGRKRYTKLSYLLHRYAEKQTEGYLKKAAGPYNPATRYKGPEAIAQKNKYIKHIKSGNYSGFVVADDINKAVDYFKKWYGQHSLQWLGQFKKIPNDTLELWTTVDMAVQDLKKEGKKVSIESVKALIQNTKEWRPKLKRPVFSDKNINVAIKKSEELFV